MVYFPVSLPEAFYADGRQGDSAGHHAVGADLSGAPAVPRYVEYSPSGEQFIVLCAKSVSLWNSQANAILVSQRLAVALPSTHAPIPCGTTMQSGRALRIRAAKSAQL